MRNLTGEPQIYVPQCCRCCGRMRFELTGKPRPLLKHIPDHPMGDASYCVDCREGGRWYRAT